MVGLEAITAIMDQEVGKTLYRSADCQRANTERHTTILLLYKCVKRKTRVTKTSYVALLIKLNASMLQICHKYTRFALVVWYGSSFLPLKKKDAVHNLKFCVIFLCFLSGRNKLL